MNEASKTRNLWSPAEIALLSGDGIDIGCGPDPVTPTVQQFDFEHGDANDIGNFVTDRFDFVFSAHCLEHMKDPAHALAGWWQLLRVGGHLIVLVPDEDLYEQRYWPSLFNTDHKSTFTIDKGSSWSPRSFNVIDLMKQLPNADIISIKRCDHGYDRRYLHSFVYPNGLGRLLARCLGFAIKRSARFARFGRSVAMFLRIPIDQTQGDTLAQIQAIVRKKEMQGSGDPSA